MKARFSIMLAVVVIGTMVLAACGPSGGGGAAQQPAATTAAQPTTAPAATTAPEPTTAPAATTAITSTTATTTTAPAATTAVTSTTATTTTAPAATTAVTTTTATTGTTGTTGGATASGNIDCQGAKSGDTLSMLYQWSGTEEQKISAILKPLADACGITMKPESTRDQALLDTRVKAGTPPDVAFWQVTTIKQYADKLKSLDTLGVNAANYPKSLQDQGSVNGKWFGLPVKTDIKTIIWYSPTNFKALGYTVPKTWDELNTLVEKMVADGHVPWSMGFESSAATGWTGADTIEDILLVQKGPDYINNIINGTQSYNDAGVKTAWETYGKWASDPKYTVGGAKGTLSTGFNDAINQVFADPPKALMVRQSGFAGGTITAQYPTLKYGTDYDFFQVPDAKGMQLGTDWMLVFSDKPAVKALVAYLSSDLGAANWAKQAFDLTPNLKGAGNYTDPLMTKKAELLNAAKATVPSIGDVITGGFNNTLWTGIINYVNGGNVDEQLKTIAAAQASAVKK